MSATGRNLIVDWINAQPAGTRQRLKSALNTTLWLLEGHQVLDRPLVGQLRGKPCKGLYEIVLKVDKTQFRAIGCYGPKNREFTLLAGATEKDNRFVPHDICDTANRRRQDITKRSHVCAHEFN